jgi:hypothetical protein
MRKIENTKLKVSIFAPEDTNKWIEELLYKNIARMLYNKPDFKDNLLANKQVS